MELLDGLVLLPHIHHLALELLGFLAHALRHEAHLAALHGEEAGLVLVGLDLLGAAGVGHVLLLDPRGDLVDHVLVVADVLLDFAGVDVEIQDAVRKCVQELGIVGDDEAGLGVVDQECGQVLDAGLVEVVGGLV